MYGLLSWEGQASFYEKTPLSVYPSLSSNTFTGTSYFSIFPFPWFTTVIECLGEEKIIYTKLEDNYEDTKVK